MPSAKDNKERRTTWAAAAAADDLILRRALAGYFSQPGCAFPECWDVEKKVVDELAYVSIVSVGRGTLAVYRVMNDGQLRRLKQWPAKVAAPYPAPEK